MKTFTRILIVDDENVFRSTLRQLLPWEEEGFLLVGFAENGQQALSLLDATMPHIVITDIAMPVMDGLELVKEIEKRNALAQHPNEHTGVIVVSGFETFSYVREAMKHGAFDYILKSELSRDAILQRLRALADSLPCTHGEDSLGFSQFFSNLVNGAYSNSAFVQEHIAKYGLRLRADQPLFLAQSFCSDPAESSVQTADARRLLSQRLAGASIAVFLHHESCLLLGEWAQLSRARQQLELSQDEFPALYWGFSEKIPCLPQCPQALSALKHIPQQYFYTPGRRVFFAEARPAPTTPEPISPDAVSSAAAQLDLQEVMSLLGNYLRGCQQTNADPYAVRKNCEHAVYLLILALEKHGLSQQNLGLKKIEYFQQIDRACSIDELCDVLDDVLFDITSLYGAQAEGPASLLRDINAYITQNYMYPIHLSDLAGHVHLSYHYLSRILKHAYGETFNDYLNRIRIEAAQKLLCSTDRELRDIAESVGFSDQSYFGKIFKKYTSCSPRIYRLQHTN